MKQKEVEVVQCKRVMVPEKYFYTVCVPVYKEEIRKVIVCSTVMKEVEYTCTVMVPKTVQKKVMCTTYKCETVMVKEMVPVCKTVCVTAVDECGRCYTHRERVTCMEERTRCVDQADAGRHGADRQLRHRVRSGATKAKKMVCEIVRSEREEMVKVCSFVNKTGNAPAWCANRDREGQGQGELLRDGSL